MIAYKLFKQRANGTLGPLFINRRQIVPLKQWLNAECHPTKGYAVRPGWHCCSEPVAPHLSKKGRVWAVVDIMDWSPNQRPKAQGGLWYIAAGIIVLCTLPHQCPFCNNLKPLRYVGADEPWQAKHLTCPLCSRTYNIGEFDK